MPKTDICGILMLQLHGANTLLQKSKKPVPVHLSDVFWNRLFISHAFSDDFKKIWLDSIYIIHFKWRCMYTNFAQSVLIKELFLTFAVKYVYLSQNQEMDYQPSDYN